jgi:putative CocE/NonD family hydrolase
MEWSVEEDRVMNKNAATEFDAYQKPRPPRYRGVTTQSRYLHVRDGVKIAVDVILPQDLPPGDEIPAILITARYWRSFQLRMQQPGKAPMGPRAAIADFLVGHGYAVVTVDARGSGASFGSWPYPFSRSEIDDMGDVVSWIVDQSWSNGAVGAIGISYKGTTAELLAVAHPTATKAVVPQQIEFDLYTDIVRPGGIFNEWFMKVWDETNRQLDANQVPREWGFGARLFVKGVRPVDDDEDRAQLGNAVAEHKENPEVYRVARSIVFRDDPFGSLDVTLDDMSVFRHLAEIEESGAAISGWGSWLDGASADTVIRRFINVNNPQRAVIGAWSHNLETHGSPYAKPKARPVPPKEAQWQQCLRFLDDHLLGEADNASADKTLVYFTMGEERWKATSVWPPEGLTIHRWYLAADGVLSPEPPVAESAADLYTIDFEATTGKTNRWHTPDGVAPVIYGDRAREDRRLLTYTSRPLAKNTEITGYPVVTLFVASTAPDGAFYVYLEDVDAKGRVTYVTEGQLRAIHRQASPQPPPYRMLVPYHSFRRRDAKPLEPGQVAELNFGLLPTSVLVRKGHRLRIAIAGHDKDTFERIPEEGIPVLEVQRSRVYASHVDLPVIE